MKTPVLLVSTTTRWFGTARIPGALAKAGFDVSLLTPRNSLAEKSRFVARVGYLPDDATPMQWVFAFATMVKAIAPRLVLPCDDMAFRLLQMLVLSPPRDLQPTLQLQLGALIRESLGESAHYRSSVDKTVLPQAAEALGVRVPPWAIVTTPEEAEAMTSTLGFPLVLKRGYGFAGEGVAICSERAELHRAFSVLSNEDTLNLEGATGTRLLAQAHVPGGISYYGVAAWKGALLAGYATDKVVANPEPKGPATVLRYHRAPEIRGFAEKLARGFGMSARASPTCWRSIGASHRERSVAAFSTSTCAQLCAQRWMGCLRHRAATSTKANAAYGQISRRNGCAIPVVVICATTRSTFPGMTRS